MRLRGDLHGECRDEVRCMYLSKLRKNSTRLNILSDDYDNIPHVALSLGYPPSLLSPRLKEFYQRYIAHMSELPGPSPSPILADDVASQVGGHARSQPALALTDAAVPDPSSVSGDASPVLTTTAPEAPTTTQQSTPTQQRNELVVGIAPVIVGTNEPQVSWTMPRMTIARLPNRSGETPPAKRKRGQTSVQANLQQLALERAALAEASSEAVPAGQTSSSSEASGSSHAVSGIQLGAVEEAPDESPLPLVGVDPADL